MKDSIGIKINIGFALALAMLAVIGIVAYRSTVRLIETARQVAHTHLVLEKLEAVFSDLKDAESGRRGYYIAQNPRHLELCRSAIRATESDFRDLRQLIADNPGQQGKMDTLQPHIASKIALIHQMIALQQKGERDSPLQVTLTNKATEVVEEIRRVISAMKEEENRLLAHRVRQSDRSARNTVFTLALGSLLALLSVVLASLIINRDITKRKDAEESLRKAKEDLEIRVSERTVELRDANQQLRQELADRKRMEEMLLNSERRLRQVIDLVPHSIFAKDRRGRFLLANRRCAELLGTTPEELVRKAQLEITPSEEEARNYLQDDLEVITGRRTKFIPEETFTDPEGNVHILQTYKVPFTITEAQELAVLGVSIEITDRKRAEAILQEVNESLQAIIRASPLAIMTLDPEGNIKKWNPAAERIFGWKEEEVLDRLYPLARGEQLAEFHAIRKRVLHGESFLALELVRSRKDGSPIDISLWVAPLRDARGGIYGIIALLQDITDRKQAEEEIRRLNAELEQRVIERTAQLEAANRQLQAEIVERIQAEEKIQNLNRELEKNLVDLSAINKEMEAFSYSVSHDLRAPLRAIDGFSHALLEDYGDQLDALGHDYLNRVRAASQRMALLIDDLLTLSRITRQEIRREKVDLSVLSQTVAGELQQTDPGRRVEWVIAPGISVSADVRLLRVMMENLLGNAWKFTEKHHQARIEVGVMNQKEKPVYFVRDDGAGFDMAYAGKLFGAFQRLHTADEFQGTGIGLATVQRIIHKHGGHVWAESEVGKGTSFYFTL